MSKKIFVSVFLLLLVSFININAQKVDLSFPDEITEGVNKQVTIPLEINAGIISIKSLNLKITYNPNVFIIDSINTAGALGYGAICNPVKGNALIAYMNINGFKGKGNLLYLKGHTVAKGKTDITLEKGSCVYNNNIGFNVTRQGKITVQDSLSMPPTWVASGAAYMPNVTLTEGTLHKFTYKAVCAAGSSAKYKLLVNKNKKQVSVKWININAETGELTINAPKGSAGTYAISVAANDGTNKDVLAPISVLTVSRKSSSKK